MATSREGIPQAGSGRQALATIVARSDELIGRLQNAAFEPETQKRLSRTYSITQASSMIGRSATAIRKAEAEGALPAPRLSSKGRRSGYDLQDVNRMRDHFGTNPYRAEGEEPIRLAFQNFKGGVGKSTMTCHFAQYLAEKGYRVLVLDCDPQASTSTTFGLRPDFDLEEGDTLLPFLEGSATSIADAVRATYWERLDIVPANLGLYNAEYLLAAKAAVPSSADSVINSLHAGISQIEHHYDVIIMDPPPALGMIALNVARAANALVVPASPTMYDFHSTVSFFRMMEEVMETVERAVGEAVNYKFFKLLLSRFGAGKGAHEFMSALMGECYGLHMIQSAVLDSAEIDNAAAEWRTVYELEKHTTSARTYKRCVDSMNLVFGEIEGMIRHTWPSHKERLRSEGVANLVNLPDRNLLINNN